MRRFIYFRAKRRRRKFKRKTGAQGLRREMDFQSISQTPKSYFTFSVFMGNSDDTAQIALFTAIIRAESVATFLLLGKIFSAKKARGTFFKK